MSDTATRADVTPVPAELRLTMSAAVQARWAHRVDGLIHSHPWSVEATVQGPADADMVMPADDLEAILHALLAEWQGRYLTDEDVGTWKGYEPLVWEREPTVEEIARQLWRRLDEQVPGLSGLSVVEATEFDRTRTIRLSRPA